jgi:uncharacterized protein
VSRPVATVPEPERTDIMIQQPVTTVDDLRQVLAPPSGRVLAKEIHELDEHCRSFIARSPFVLVGSTDGAGRVDVSPKGDPPGFVQVLDASTLAVPERLGNHRADTFLNVLEHPTVGLLFLVPGSNNTLRIRGTARIARDRALRDRFAMDGRVPELVLVVHVTSAFFHCGKSTIRSRLWHEPPDPPAGDRLLATAMVDHGRLDISIDEMHRIITDDEQSRLY